MATDPGCVRIASSWYSCCFSRCMKLGRVCSRTGFWGLLATFAASAAGPLDNWTVRHTDPAFNLLHVTYAQGIFVAVGSHGAILTSPDGSSWTPRSSGVSQDLRHVTFGNGEFVAMGNVDKYGGSLLVTSLDGASWSSREVWTFQGTTIRSMIWANNHFVAAATVLGGNTGSIHTSPDGVSWTTLFSSDNTTLLDVIFASGTFVAVGGRSILSSANGLAWIDRADFTGGPIVSVAYRQNTFAAVTSMAFSLTSEVITSTNGLDWTAHDPGGYYLSGITCGNGQFIAVGFNGIILSSGDAIHWTERTSGVAPNQGEASRIASVVYGRAAFVAVGGSGLILQSGHYGPPILTGRPVPESGSFEVRVESDPGSSFVLQASTNGVDWAEACSFTNAATMTSFVDSTVVNTSRRFYRTVSP
jgi:hypothetical protein